MGWDGMPGGTHPPTEREEHKQEQEPPLYCHFQAGKFFCIACGADKERAG